MPPKIRELIAALNRAGFSDRGGKGSHRNFDTREPGHKSRYQDEAEATPKPTKYVQFGTR